ncbi:helix-turn-helix domain-containing protein [uncultured Draconibacterium sp.]|uniref:helix-turn-helix domain-containing protein n=1 Tax=uncultured Draconibacterium sp. TaxID=1573823 RepID=UPI003217BF68
MKKKKLITELRMAIREELQSLTTVYPKWIRSSQVREMLSISYSTLQTLRINGTIPAYKMGTTWMYKYDEIVAVLEANCTKRKEMSHA